MFGALGSPGSLLKEVEGGEKVFFGSAFVCLVDMFFVFKVGNEDLNNRYEEIYSRL